MLKNFLLLFIILTSLGATAQRDTLFTIQQHGKNGYINARGQIIIPPIYYATCEFSEGLAAVRENGLYGYINTKGQYQIAPAFDKAGPFLNGLAIVTKAGQPFVIDPTGQALFPPVFTSLAFISPTKAIVKTRSRSNGLLDIPSRQLIIDTIYWRMNAYEGNVIIAEKHNYNSRKYTYPRAAVFDTLGRTMVPIDQYEEIKPFVNGLALVSIKGRRKDDDSDEGLIDIHGKLLFRRPATAPGYISGDFHDGLATISLEKQRSYEGYINRQGNLVLDDTNYLRATDFSRGRAFIRTEQDKYFLIDTTFTILNKEPFDDVEQMPFSGLYAIVKSEDHWGIIDTNARYIIPPLFPSIDRIIGNYFVYSHDESQYERRLFGIMSLDSQLLINSVIQQYDPAGFVNGLLKTVIDNKITYINQQGRQVWQEVPDTSRFLRKLNIDHIARAHFTAYSTLTPDGDHRSGGWATSNNFPRKKRPALPVPANRLSLVIDTARVDTFAGRYYGFSLYLTNTTADTVLFRAQDSWLNMKVQAQDEKGLWKDIEYMPETFCGNSYHWVRLEPGAHWKFVVPEYEGAFNTLLRVELKYPDPANRSKEKILYSQSFRGSINLSQFSVKEPYYSQGIMDPYVD